MDLCLKPSHLTGRDPATSMAEKKTKNNNRKNMLHVKTGRRLRLAYLRILRIDDPPERIARGAAIGVCMGIFPTFGAGIIFSLIGAFMLKANKAAAVLGSFIMNPLTSPVFWSLSIIVGSAVTGQDSHTIFNMIKTEGLLRGAGGAYLVFMAGNVIVTGVFTVASYFLIKNAVIRHRRRKALKRSRKRAEQQTTS